MDLNLKDKTLEQLYAAHDFYVLAGQKDNVTQVDAEIVSRLPAQIQESVSASLDEHYAEQAIELARSAARAIEECHVYAEDISDKKLRDETEATIERILNEV